MNIRHKNHLHSIPYCSLPLVDNKKGGTQYETKIIRIHQVSTTQQNTTRQDIELEKFGVAKKDIYTDKISGKDFNRSNYQKLRKKLKEGDILAIKSLDRLGRNYEEIQKEWSYLTKTVGAHMVVLDMPILDTRIEKDLMGNVISDIVLQLLSYVAQTERELIRQRQAEGIALAKAQGKHLGRPRRPYPQGFERVFTEIQGKQCTLQEGASALNLKPAALRWFITRKKEDLEKTES